MKWNVVFAIALSLALVIVYGRWFAPRPPIAKPPVTARGTVASTGTGAATGGVATGTRAHAEAETGDGAAPRAPARKPSAAFPEGADVRIGNDRVDLTFATRGGALRAAEAWACVYHEHGDRSVRGDPGETTGWIDAMPGALAVDLLGGSTDLETSSCKLTSEGGEVSVECPVVDGVLVTKSIRPSSDPKNPWGSDVTIRVRNVSGDENAARTLEVVGPVLAPSPPTDADAAILVAQAGPEGEIEVLRGADVQKLLAANPLAERRTAIGWAWIAQRADFYLGALVPVEPLDAKATVTFKQGTRPNEKGQPVAVAAAAFRIPLTLPRRGEAKEYRFLLYSGPNQRSLLSDENSPFHMLHGATVQRSFLISLAPIQRFLAWLLSVLASTGIGYGLAVLGLTILVRGALFPLSRKSQISMRLHAQKMSRLKPKMDAVKEKHKDPRKQQEQIMKLMREEKVSLLPGGCLLAFLQMPIWIALYGVLQTTFEMRHASFLWVKDLTQPDHLARLPFFDSVFFLPGWLNLLPLIMMVVWYLSAAMQPLPADPQQAQQAKMMRWMPVLFGFMLYGTASGLTLYMTMSALWSIGETWLIRKVWLAKLENALK